MDDSKRFWLTTSQRDTLVNALLSTQQSLEDAAKGPSWAQIEHNTTAQQVAVKGDQNEL